MAGTTLADAAARKALIEGGPAAITASADPLIALARRVEPVIRELRAWQEEKIQSVERQRRPEDRRGPLRRLRQVGLSGRQLQPPPRVRHGARLRGRHDARAVQDDVLRTVRAGRGVRREAAVHLPARWRDGRAKLDLATPYNFVYTADTIGGNSGSPVINRNAEICGINFDSNVQKLPNRYMYIDEAEGSRAVGVHSAGIIEGLRKLYGADALVAELTGQQ